MIFILGFVNTELVNNRVDKKFSTMEALLDYVEGEGFEWHSLVIGIVNEPNTEEIPETGEEWFKKAQLR